jgi:hypothetical protein
MQGCDYLDATPRQGDVFALIVCLTSVDEARKTATVKHQLLIHVSFIKGSHDANSVAKEIYHGLGKCRLTVNEVVGTGADECYVNGAALRAS